MTRVHCALLWCLALLLAAGDASSQPLGTPAGRDTYVIVHGAWGGGWDWRQVDSLLTARGHRVLRPDLTGLASRSHLASASIGLDTHIADIENVIVWEELRDVVLVGHSYGGMVITGVADRLPGRVRELVYVDAFLPDSGESVMTLADERRRAVFSANVQNGLMMPVWQSEDTAVPRDTPHPYRTFTDTLHLSRPVTVPARYILTSEPAVQPDAFQRFADRAAARGWTVVTMTAGHTPERTHPRELVEILLRR